MSISPSVSAPPALRLAPTPVRAASPVMYAVVLALVLWTPLPFGSVESWSVGIIRLAACAFLVLWAIHGVRNRAYAVSQSLLQIPLYVAAVWAFVQVIASVSVDSFMTIETGITLLAMAVFVSSALLALDSPARIERAAIILFWFGFALSVFAIVQNLTGTRNIYWLRASPVVNFFGPFVNRNHFAGLMEILLPLGIGPLLTGGVPRERRVMIFFLALTILAAVAMSRSRGGMLAVAAQIIVLVALVVIAKRADAGPKRATALAVVLVSVILLGVGLAWIGAGPVTETLSSIPSDVVDQSETSRLEIWRSTISLIAVHPVTGSGLGAYGTAILPYWKATEYSTLLYAHNDYLQVLADAGIPGALLAILFAFVLGTALVKSLKIVDPTVRGVAFGAGAGCIGLLIHSVVDFNLQIPSNAIAFLFASVVLVRASSAWTPTVDRA